MSSQPRKRESIRDEFDLPSRDRTASSFTASRSRLCNRDKWTLTGEPRIWVEGLTVIDSASDHRIQSYRTRGNI